MYFLIKTTTKSPKTENSNKDITTPNETPTTENLHPTEQSKYKDAYQAKYLLTRNEWYEYKKLKKLAEGEGLQICPKVRLLDIIEPRTGSNYMSLLGKIQSKHVDFVICDQDLHIKAILELDDNSHNQKDRQERDTFVDEILTSVGYTVIRTRSITDNTLDPIKPKETNEAPKA